MEIIVARCLDLRYEEGGYYTSQRVKDGTGITRNGDYTMYPQRFGVGKNIKPSRLNLYIEVDGKAQITWVDKYFKDTVGRLTDKRIDKIMNTMPATVEVIEYEGFQSSKYYVVTDKSLDAWLSNTNLKGGL